MKTTSLLLFLAFFLNAHAFAQKQTISNNPSTAKPAKALINCSLGPAGDKKTREQTKAKLNAWQRECERKIALFRKPGSNSTFMAFNLDECGNIKNLRILKSSGDNSIDENSMSAIQCAGPFTPCPIQFLAKRDITVQFLEYPKLSVAVGMRTN